MSAVPAAREIPVPELTPVAEIVVELGEPRDFGVTRDGARRFTPILGGTFAGLGGPIDELRAELLPGGGDRQLVRADGAVEIDASYDARTDSGALIGIRALGVRVPPATAGSAPYFRVMLRFESSDPTFGALQNALFIADGVRDATQVRHTVYRVG